MKRQTPGDSSGAGAPQEPSPALLSLPPSCTSNASSRDNLHTPDRGNNSPRQTRVLLAEDNDEVREIITVFLIDVGYSVTACRDAELASEAFRADGLTDILMTDLEMPGRSGLELARELTALRPSLPVMIVSGAFISQEMDAEIRHRNWKYLSKPCRLTIILQMLQSLHHQQSQGWAA